MMWIILLWELNHVMVGYPSKDIKPYIEMSESTLYTILKRLEESKMLTVRTAEHDGRLRKYYRITKKGIERLEEFKEEWREVMTIYQFVNKEGC